MMIPKYFAVLLIAVVGCSAAWAGITNETFSDGPDGLDGWTDKYGTPNPDTLFTFSPYAIFLEIESDQNVIGISQVFDIDAGDDLLTFDLQFISGAGSESDYFTAELRENDSTGDVLYSYSWNNHDDPPSLTTSLEWDLSSLGVSTAYLAFELTPDGAASLSPDYGDIFTKINVSNVMTSESIQVIPVPGALALGGIGIGLIALRKKYF